MAATSLSIFCACPCSPSPRFQASPPPPPPWLSVCCHSHHLSLSPIDKTFTQIHNSGVIACLRANSAELALKAARAALTGGISVLEIVMSTPGVFEVLQQLAQEYPTTTLGVGTVLNVEDAKNAINAGAKFLMSPAMVKDIMVDAQCGEVLYIPGVMTPTEILSAYDSGAKIVKVYPVSALGGGQYISALKRPFHHISMVAAQGITIDSVREYITRGASAVVLSDAIFDKEAISQNNFNEIYQLAHFAALQGNEAVEW
ncbi:khg/kdpg aldolase [Fagus crenata]